jgi:hypothetical protein
MVFVLAAPDRDLGPVVLDLEDYNPELKASPRNPVNFNSPRNPYLCQPGQCSHVTPLVNEPITKEKYWFCGFQTKMGLSLEGYDPSNVTCSVTESADIISRLREAGAVPVEVDATSVYEVCS